VYGAAAGRILVGALVLSLSGQCVLAAEPTQKINPDTPSISPDTPSPAPNLKTSIAREAETLALFQTSTGSGKNKYFWPGIGLMAGGGALVLLAFNQADNTDIVCGRVTCDTTGHPFSLVYAGLGAAAVGAILFVRGEQLKDRKFGPLIDIKPHGVRMLLHVGF
jgi:hypothetical protein